MTTVKATKRQSFGPTMRDLPADLPRDKKKLFLDYVRDKTRRHQFLCFRNQSGEWLVFDAELGQDVLLFIPFLYETLGRLAMGDEAWFAEGELA